MKSVMIIGLPNTGKSITFSNLTGRFTEVANSPLTTITVKRAEVDLGNGVWEVIDTPGLHSLYIHSEDEQQVRHALFKERPDVILQCIDANRLKQSLALTVELLSLRAPLVLCINAVDETMRKGIRIDAALLSRMLGVFVVESMALQAKGIEALKDALIHAAPPGLSFSYGDLIDEGLARIESFLARAPYPGAGAMLLLAGDPGIEKELEPFVSAGDRETVRQRIRATRQRFRRNIHRVMEIRKSRWIDWVVGKIVSSRPGTATGTALAVARITRHPFWGLLLLAAVVYAMFFGVVHVANTLADWMTRLFWLPVEAAVEHAVAPGVWRDFLIGDYGVLSLGLANALLTVLPILSVFFLMFNTLEDTGYIPNLSVLTRRLLGKVGLSGSAIMPLVLGFGCKTMATMTTRNLTSFKERYIAIFLIAFGIPCAAQMGLNMSILGHMGSTAFLIAFSVLFGVEVTAGLLLNRMVKETGDRDAFVMELPPIRMPSAKWVLKKTYYKLYWFLRESLMVFVYAALILFVADRMGALDMAKHALRPLVEGFLGLPVAMVDALILCMARHEAAAALIIRLIQQGRLDYVQCIVAVTITTMLVPCFANIMAMAKELGAKRTAAMIVLINASAFLVAGALNHVLKAVF